MIDFAQRIESAVKAELADQTPAAVIITPLVNMLARITVGVHTKTGADVEGLLDIIRNQLDEAVIHYAAHNRTPDRRTDEAPRD